MSTSIEERIIFPILKAYDWVGKEHAVHQNFLDIDRTPNMVMICNTVICLLLKKKK